MSCYATSTTGAGTRHFLRPSSSRFAPSMMAVSAICAAFATAVDTTLCLPKPFWLAHLPWPKVLATGSLDGVAIHLLLLHAVASSSSPRHGRAALPPPEQRNKGHHGVDLYAGSGRLLLVLVSPGGP